MPAAVAFEEFFKRYAQLPAKERGVEVEAIHYKPRQGAAHGT